MKKFISDQCSKCGTEAKKGACSMRYLPTVHKPDLTKVRRLVRDYGRVVAILGTIFLLVVGWIWNNYRLTEASKVRYSGEVIDREKGDGNFNTFTLKLDGGGFKAFDTLDRPLYDQLQLGARVELIGVDVFFSHPSDVLRIDRVISVKQKNE
jgi:hypothetical protein